MGVAFGLLFGLGPLGLPELVILVFLAGIVGLPVAIILAVANKGSKRTLQHPQLDAATQLRELARLHDEHILTDEEYEAKRSNIAQRL